MSFIAINIYDVYKTYFQPRYKVGSTEVSAYDPGYKVEAKGSSAPQTTALGIPISKPGYLGREVFLPVTFWVSEKLQLTVDCCTVRVTAKKTIIRTPVAERKGTVKEQFNVEDYRFTVKGVLIGADRKFPDDQMTVLRNIFESTKPVQMRNALVELFMSGENRVAIESFEFPEQEGKAMHHRPFTLECESDFIDQLKIEV